ncbi:MAG: tetratricopeptide repeat protein [Ignavibacteriaceae bacterium]
MLTKEQIVNLTEIIAIGSVTVAGFVIGGTIGSSVMAGIGINLATNIVHKGTSKLKEHWLTNTNGILNHDIQRALLRAYIKALAQIQNEYFGLYDELQENEKENSGAIRAFFKELTDQAEKSFLSSLERAITEKEVKEYLYNYPESAIDLLWERIGANDLLYTYNQYFKYFLRKNLLSKVQFYFAEELKTDNRECNKAWRAFQRMLLDGIQADVRDLKKSQVQIQQDLKKLDEIRLQLDRLSTVIDHRLPDEPFQNELENFLQKIRPLLFGIDKTTRKIASDVTDIKMLLSSKSEVEAPKLPDNIQNLIDQGWSLRESGKYEEARRLFENALEVATVSKHNLAASKAKYCLASILNEWDQNPNGAIELLDECLLQFKVEKSEIDVAATLYYLGSISIDLGKLDDAEAYLSQALELDRKHGHRQSIAHTLHQMGWLEDHRGNDEQAINMYDQALSQYLSLHHEKESKTEKDAARGVASCYHHKALIYRHKG